MSDPFHSLSISGSGMNVYRTWLDAIADNVANVNNVTSTDKAAFQERFIVARAASTNGRPDGARVAAAKFGNALGRVVYDPQHPLADNEGFVRLPDMDLTDQMAHLVVAQRAYQANVSAFQSARDAYAKALEIGK